MWYPRSRRVPNWTAAQKFLSSADPVLRRIIRGYGPCTLSPRRDHFVLLCMSIFNQQISMAAATALFARFRRLFPRGRPTPARLLELSDEQLRSAGLSRQKLAYLRDLARHFVGGRIPTRHFARMDDQQIIDALCAVKGIGRWTAEMHLIFVMNRPDVLPVDDLGLLKGVKRAFGQKSLPSPAEVRDLAEPWRPWRTIATWYLWRASED